LFLFFFCINFEHVSLSQLEQICKNPILMILADSFFSGFREMCGLHHWRVGDWSKVKLKQVGKEIHRGKGLMNGIEILPLL